jgi:hypothetical protein
VTARLLRGTETTVALLALKEIKAVHESARELRVMVGRIQERFGTRDRTLNICSDRCAMNECAFRAGRRLQELLTGGLWLPCTCHIRNNLLGRFLENISEIVRSIFRLQQRFRKLAPFLSFLASRQARVQSIPSYSTVRWYRCCALFTSILAVWDYMVEFTALEELEIRELQPAVWMDVERLGQLASTFRDGQEVLESERFAAGSHFIGVLLSIRHQVTKFTDQPAAVQQFEQQVLDYKLEYQTEYLAFLLMAFLSPSVQFIVGRTCSHEEYEAARGLLADLVCLEIGSDNPASDNRRDQAATTSARP